MTKLYLAQCIRNEPDPMECAGEIKVFLSKQERDEFVKKENEGESEYRYWDDRDINIPQASSSGLPVLVGPGYTPNASLPPLFDLEKDGGTRKMVITIDAPANFEMRLDNQWVVEREIHADRWNWEWADQVK